MDQISLHISYLLLTCGYANVPGLGTFKATYEKAYFDSGLNIFYPSRIRIDFFEKEFNASFSLVDSLARKLKIDTSEALAIIKEFVDTLKKKLASTKYYRLDGIGYLIDNNGSLLLKDTFRKRNKYPVLSPMRV